MSFISHRIDNEIVMPYILKWISFTVDILNVWPLLSTPRVELRNALFSCKTLAIACEKFHVLQEF